ncbi:aldo/keto reductase [Phlyctema vagabunda]|uniref:Aldo/keto reductase n=1 Tax=Phlyctema vagabunda TaxID=108571 RepID=A0ABR4P8U1_9HELO
MPGAALNGVEAPAKAAHINMMTDTIISSLPAEGLRAVMRSILVADPTFTKHFENESQRWLQKTTPASMPTLFTSSGDSGTKGNIAINPAFEGIQKRIRAMMGCGLGFECLGLLQQIVSQAEDLNFDEESEDGEALMDVLASVDGDIVQAVTSASKTLLVGSGKRAMSDRETEIQEGVLKTLQDAQSKAEAKGMEFMFERGLNVVEKENF